MSPAKTASPCHHLSPAQLSPACRHSSLSPQRRAWPPVPFDGHHDAPSRSCLTHGHVALPLHADASVVRQVRLELDVSGMRLLGVSRYQWSSATSGLAAAIAAANRQADPMKQAQLMLSSTVMAGLAVRLLPDSAFAPMTPCRAPSPWHISRWLLMPWLSNHSSSPTAWFRASCNPMRHMFICCLQGLVSSDPHRHACGLPNDTHGSGTFASRCMCALQLCHPAAGMHAGCHTPAGRLQAIQARPRCAPCRTPRIG